MQIQLSLAESRLITKAGVWELFAMAWKYRSFDEFEHPLPIDKRKDFSFAKRNQDTKATKAKEARLLKISKPDL